MIWDMTHDSGQILGLTNPEKYPRALGPPPLSFPAPFVGNSLTIVAKAYSIAVKGRLKGTQYPGLTLSRQDPPSLSLLKTLRI